MKLELGLLYSKENTDKRGRGVSREYWNAGTTILSSVSTVYTSTRHGNPANFNLPQQNPI
jgi:hypothetical protein